jgi:ankyrin repeat protein
MIALLKKLVVFAVIAIVAVALLLCTGCSRSLEAKLRLAACGGDITKAKNLLKRGMNVNATDVLGNSALTYVEGCKGHDDPTRVQLVELLIAKGAAVNFPDRDGCTALMYAARNGDTQAVNALLRNGASVNIADKEGETALMKAAASSCNEETVRALLSAGADLTARDHKGRSALDSFRSSYACPESKVGDLLQIAGTEKGR